MRLLLLGVLAGVGLAFTNGGQARAEEASVLVGVLRPNPPASRSLEHWDRGGLAGLGMLLPNGRPLTRFLEHWERVGLSERLARPEWRLEVGGKSFPLDLGKDPRRHELARRLAGQKVRVVARDQQWVLERSLAPSDGPQVLIGLAPVRMTGYVVLSLEAVR